MGDGVLDPWSGDEDVWGEAAEPDRDVTLIRVSKIGKVDPTPDSKVAYRWTCPENPRAERAVNSYLLRLAAAKNRPKTLRSYAYDLQRWLRFLDGIDTPFDEATRTDYYDFLRFLSFNGKTGGAKKARASNERVNAITRKVRPDETEFHDSTLQHSRTVLHEWYEFLHDKAGKPLINPIPHSLRRERGEQSVNAHRNPMDEWQLPQRTSGTGRKPAKRAPRHMPDPHFDAFFATLSCHRDRALVTMAVDSGPRPEELVSLLGADVDWGNALITVTRKGTRNRDTIPVSRDAISWLRLAQEESGYVAAADQPLWVTRRKPRRPFTYDAYRAIFIRANVRLGTDWTPHDLRHTAAVRMLDSGMPERQVQEILGHASNKTLSKYTRPRLEDIIEAQQEAAARPKPRPTITATQYQADDMRELFGGGSL